MTDFFADLHIHSRFSRATSKSLTLPLLAAWAQVKGLSVLGTGDFTHPLWLQELKEHLRYDEETGLCILPQQEKVLTAQALPHEPAPVYFMLQGEISSVYKREGKTRKVHNIVFMPHFTAAQKFCKRLAKVGNLSADGRPILGLDSRDLLEMVLETDPDAFLIPAHIWTPWYSLFGSKSGFDSVEECFGDLASHVFALETGLSSDPAMNRLVSALDAFRLVSNSDAHSAEKLGREANHFEGRIHYQGILSALRSPQADAETRFLGTLEYFSQEGKYYADGHRRCEVCWLPEETLAHEGKCPVCGKAVTVGVLNRIMALADRQTPVYPDETSAQHLVPLAEILAEIFGLGSKSLKVQRMYESAIKRFGTELFILRQAETSDLNRFLNPLGEAIERVRRGVVTVQKGYDGLYGAVQIFTDDEKRTIVREVGEGARPQKKQAQDLSLLGESKMVGKNVEAEALSGKTKNQGHGKDDSDLSMTLEEREERSPAQNEDAAQKNNQADSLQNPVLASSKLVDGIVGEPHGDSVNDDSDRETDGGAENTATSISGNFLFSDMNDEPTEEPLPFLPLSEEEGVPVFPEERLNLEQRAAAFVDNCPTLLMAGAGTGKTYTLFARLCHLLRQGAVPRSLLVVTFTRKAATEMDRRLLELFGQGTKLPVIDTLYALALDLWHKTHADVPVLLSDESARQVFGEANIEEDAKNITAAWESISLSRLLLKPADDEYSAYASRYTAHKSAWNLADYTDLLEFWLEQARSGIFKPLWDYVLVDEVQELSPLGRALVAAIVPSSGRGFFGVGDSDQTLYKVSGDDVGVVEAFQKQWPDLQLLTLMTGFRAQKGLWEVSRSILHADDSVIENSSPLPGFQGAAHGNGKGGSESSGRINTPEQPFFDSPPAGSDKAMPASSSAVTGDLSVWQGQANVVSVQSHAASIHVFKAPTDEAEVQWITDKIAVLLGGITSTPDYEAKAAEVFLPARVYRPGDIAVLVRSKDLGHAIRRSLSRIGIGVMEPQSDVFWADARVRILLQLGCRMLGISLMEHEGSDVPDCPDKVLAKGPLAMSAFLSTIQPFDVLFWHSKAFRELVRVYDQCGGWSGLMTWLHLQNDLELARPQSAKVQILTLHAAKGLEFPVVFLPCLEEGILPSAGPLLSGRLDKDIDVAGERRLLYTGVARAREALFMSYAAKRRLRGADVRLKASRFLDNLPESLVTVSTLVSKKQLQEEQLNLL